MCGICGFLSYGEQPIPDVHTLTNALMEASAVRGTDAAGIAFCDKGRVSILKEGKSAYRLDFKPPEKIKALIGHTRHSTQGSEKKNYNNHPFFGKAGKVGFALAHNGVLMGEKEVRKKQKLPKTKIETDSYIAVQLIEKKGVLNHDSMKFMAESISGSYSFCILDSRGDLHIVKGDSPVSILHFPDIKLYVYASTEEILWRALIETKLFSLLKNGKFEEIQICEGEILTINSAGKRIQSSFDYQAYTYSSCFDWRCYGGYSISNGTDEDRYLHDLKAVAASMGITPEEINTLLAEGFTFDEIEDLIYNYDYMEV